MSAVLGERGREGGVVVIVVVVCVRGWDEGWGSSEGGGSLGCD